MNNLNFRAIFEPILTMSKPIKVFLWAFCALVFWPAMHALGSGNDFDIFIRAAYSLKDGTDMYLQPHLNGLYYYYSPLFAWMLQPFTVFRGLSFAHESLLPDILYDLVFVKTIWGLLTFFFIYRIIQIVKEQFNFSSPAREAWFWGLCMVFCYRWFFMNLWYGQLTVFVLWTILESLVAQWKKAHWLQLAPISLALNIKILPLFLFGKLGLDFDFKRGIVILGWVFLFIAIPFAVFPYDYILQQTSHWLQAVNPLKSNHVITVGEGGFVDLGAMVVKFFTNYEIPNEPMACITELSHDAIFKITMVLRLLAMSVVTLIYLKIKRSQLDHKLWVGISVFTAVIPLVFPHQRDYSFAFLIPSVVYLVFIWVNNFVNEKGQFDFKSWFGVQSSLFVLSLGMLGAVIFFELFSLETRYWIIGSRMQGLGGLIFVSNYFIWLNKQLYISKS